MLHSLGNLQRKLGQKDRQKETERQSNREIHRQKDRKKETERQSKREIHRQKDRQKERDRATK